MCGNIIFIKLALSISVSSGKGQSESISGLRPVVLNPGVGRFGISGGDEYSKGE